MLYFPPLEGTPAQWILAVFACSIPAYLMGRSHNTVKWYRERLEGVPSNWKRLFPFVY